MFNDEISHTEFLVKILDVLIYDNRRVSSPKLGKMLMGDTT